jgi:hypothetical protein
MAICIPAANAISSDSADGQLYFICLRRIVQVHKVIAVTGTAPEGADVLPRCHADQRDRTIELSAARAAI